jgi:hypothetical protein
VAGQNVTWNGSSIAWAAGAAAGISYVAVTTTYTAANNEGVLTNTSGGAFTVTLPASPSVGNQVVVADAGASWGTNNLTVGRNGSTIGGLAQDLVCDITGASVQFVYDGATWEVYAQIGGNGGTAVTLDGVQTLTNKTFGNSTTFSAGSAAAPAITTSGDTNTGIFFPAADTIAFAEGGVESARIDASGNFGLGVTPSAWASGNKFMDVNASASYGAFGSTDSMMLANAYWNGSNWIRKNANNAWRMAMESSSGAPSWTFQYAGNSTAGSTISWSEAMRIDSSGNLLVGTTSNPNTARINVQGVAGVHAANVRSGSSTGSGLTMIAFYDSANDFCGQITIDAGANTTQYVTSSDYRLKNTIAPMTGALEKVALLKPVTYKWNSNGSDGQGFIAHELAEVCPDAVIGAKDAVDTDGKPVYQGIDTSFLVAALAAAIQEQQAMIEQLKADVAALKGA